MNLRSSVKKIFPFLVPVVMLKEFYYDYKLYLKNSATVSYKSSDRKLIAKIVEQYHVVEKGLTMPETRLGFGVDNAMQLAKNCMNYQQLYDNANIQFNHAVAVLIEYRNYHLERNFQLLPELLETINKLETITCVAPSQQIMITRDDYFADLQKSFELFSKSRRSVRNYDGVSVPDELLLLAVDQSRITPTSCNRQPVKANVLKNKELIEKVFQIQSGNRGFGHLADKLIIVTGDLSVCHGASEKHLVYVDGGMFAMNLMYTLHQNKIVACPLNCNLTAVQDQSLRKLLNIPESEVFIVMMSCGFAPAEFKIALSERNPVNDYIRFI